MKLHFAKEFSPYPDGKYEGDGDYNATAFRRLLREKFFQAKERGEPLEVILDDVQFLSGSYLDASFGVFAKELKEEKNLFLSPKDLIIKGNLPAYEIFAAKAWEYITEATAQ